MLNKLPEQQSKLKIPEERLRGFATYAPHGQLVTAEAHDHGWDLLCYEIREFAHKWDIGTIRGYGCYVIDDRKNLILAEERDTILVEAIAKALLWAQMRPVRAEDV